MKRIKEICYMEFPFSPLFCTSPSARNFNVTIHLIELLPIWSVSFVCYIQCARTFTQVSVQWQDTDSMREELDDLQVYIYFLCMLGFWIMLTCTYLCVLNMKCYILADLLEHEVGYFVKLTCWDVPGEQVSVKWRFSTHRSGELMLLH